MLLRSRSVSFAFGTIQHFAVFFATSLNVQQQRPEHLQVAQVQRGAVVQHIVRAKRPAWSRYRPVLIFINLTGRPRFAFILTLFKIVGKSFLICSFKGIAGGQFGRSRQTEK